jgi:hypothetical protein
MNALRIGQLSTDPHIICNHQGTDGTITNKQVQSLCSPLYRARKSVVYNSITALELWLSKKGKAFFIFFVAMLFQLADRTNTSSDETDTLSGLTFRLSLLGKPLHADTSPAVDNMTLTCHTREMQDPCNVLGQ